MKFDEILELLKEKQGFTSHEQAAEYLGMSRGGYFYMKNGQGGLKDRTIERIMEGTGLEAVEIVAAWEAEHGRTAAVRESWQRWLKNTAAAIVILSLLLGGYPIESIEKMQEFEFTKPMYYALLLLGGFVAFRLLTYRRQKAKSPSATSERRLPRFRRQTAVSSRYSAIPQVPLL